MKNVDDLIRLILKGSEKESGEIKTKTYSDEPILFTASQMKNYTPSKILEMRRICKNHPFFIAQSKAEVFSNQADFMADYEDDFVYEGEYIRYYPTYAEMSNQELRGYFSWRTKVRHNCIEKTSISFVFIYMYELINQKGVKSPEDGFYKLKNFVSVYKNFDKRIEFYAKNWLADYVVYNNLDKSLFYEIENQAVDSALLTIINRHIHSNEEVFHALNQLSSYSIEKSPFYKKYKDDVIKVTCLVFDSLSEYYSTNRKNDLISKFFGKIFSERYFMFNAAVFYEEKPHCDCVYEVNDICRYVCKNDVWYRERFFSYRQKNKELGSLLKNIDWYMRQKYKFKSTLKEADTTKIFMNTVVSVVDELFIEKRQEAKPVINIDLSKLDSIRVDSAQTQDKLIIDEDSYDVSEDNFELQTELEAEKNDSSLDKCKTNYIACLLNHESTKDFCRNKGIMESVIIDEINSELFDIFGDTVIDYSGDKPYIIEDYIDELKGLIGQ